MPLLFLLTLVHAVAVSRPALAAATGSDPTTDPTTDPFPKQWYTHKCVAAAQTGFKA